MIKIMTMTKTYNPWFSKFLALDNSEIQNFNPLGNEFLKKINNCKKKIYLSSNPIRYYDDKWHTREGWILEKQYKIEVQVLE